MCWQTMNKTTRFIVFIEVYRVLEKNNSGTHNNWNGADKAREMVRRKNCNSAVCCGFVSHSTQKYLFFISQWRAASGKHIHSTKFKAKGIYSVFLTCKISVKNSHSFFFNFWTLMANGFDFKIGRLRCLWCVFGRSGQWLFSRAGADEMRNKI